MALLDRDTLFKRLRSKAENKARESARRALDGSGWPGAVPLIAAGGVQGPANCLERQRPASIKGGRGGGGMPLRPSPRLNAACLPRVGVL